MTDDHDHDPELPEPLPERQRRFVDAYMGDAKANGVKAARMAGYVGDANTLAVQASVLLRRPKVRAAMEARLENDELIAGRVERTRFLTRVMRGEEKESKPVRDAEGKVTFEDAEPILRDRLAAQEALSKLAGEQVTKLAAVNAQGEDVKSLGLDVLFAMAGMSGKVE